MNIMQQETSIMLMHLKALRIHHLAKNKLNKIVIDEAHSKMLKNFALACNTSQTSLSIQELNQAHEYLTNLIEQREKMCRPIKNDALRLKKEKEIREMNEYRLKKLDEIKKEEMSAIHEANMISKLSMIMRTECLGKMKKNTEIELQRIKESMKWDGFFIVDKKTKSDITKCKYERRIIEKELKTYEYFRIWMDFDKYNHDGNHMLVLRFNGETHVLMEDMPRLLGSENIYEFNKKPAHHQPILMEKKKIWRSWWNTAKVSESKLVEFTSRYGKNSSMVMSNFAKHIENLILRVKQLEKNIVMAEREYGVYKLVSLRATARGLTSLAESESNSSVYDVNVLKREAKSHSLMADIYSNIDNLKYNEPSERCCRILAEDHMSHLKWIDTLN